MTHFFDKRPSSKLADSYIWFFKGSFTFAFYPYVCLCPDSNDEAEWLLHLGLMAALTAVVPILPVMTAVTMGLAFTGAFIAALSTILTFPLAWAADCMESMCLSA